MTPNLKDLSTERKIQNLIQLQGELDRAVRPTAKLYRTNPEQYRQQWESYRNQTRELAEQLKTALNYFPTLLEEQAYIAEKVIEKGQHLGEGRIRLSSAKDALSRASQILQKSAFGGLPVHFLDELEKLKALHKKYSAKFKVISTEDTISYSKSLNELYKQVPDELFEAFQALPYRHPAADFLTLEPGQYHDLNESKPKRKKRAAKQANAPRVPLSAFLAFTQRVYENRKTAPWSEIMIALQLATGRRKNELGYLSTLSSSRLKSHLKIDVIAKKRPEGMKAASRAKDSEKVYIPAEHKHPIPVVFYTPDQVLELHKILVKKIASEVYADYPKALKLLKKTNDSVAFDRDVGDEIREAFHSNFPIQTPNSEASRQFGVHNVCRSVYAQHAYSMFRDTLKIYNNTTLLSFTNKALGHAEYDLTTTSDYLAILLIDDTQKTKRKVLHNLSSEPLPKRPKQTAPKGFDDSKLKDKTLLLEIVSLSGKYRNPGLLAAHIYLVNAANPKLSELKKHVKSEDVMQVYFDTLRKFQVRFDFMDTAKEQSA